MNLYPYQKKIFDEAISRIQTTNRLLLSIPTGAGKTVIFCHLIKELKKKTLIVAHTKELIYQCERTMKKLGITDATVRSIQSCSRSLDSVDGFDFLIIDECHRSGAKSYLKLIDRFSNKKILGVTATPFRHDGQKLKGIFGEIYSPLNLIDMINAGLLCDFQGYRVTTNISLKGISTKNGDFMESRLAPVINVKNRNEIIVKNYKKIAPASKAICFAVNIDHCDSLASEFKNNNISCASIHGNIPKVRRRRILEDFSSGKISVLTSCQILTEGFDEPSINCLLMARPTCSKILYTQMIGRGSRLFPGKKLCKVIEFTDNEYDVCSLEDLAGNSNKRFKIRQGERLSSYGKRLHEFLAECHDTIINPMSVISKSIWDRPATPWQREYLKTLNIYFLEPLTEISANQLITQATNG